MGRGGELSPRMADSAFFSPAANVPMPLVENCELVATMGGARSAPQARAIRKKAGPQKVLRAVGPAIKLNYFESSFFSFQSSESGTLFRQVNKKAKK